jgi:hypothetical protein
VITLRRHEVGVATLTIPILSYCWKFGGGPWDPEFLAWLGENPQLGARPAGLIPNCNTVEAWRVLAALPEFSSIKLRRPLDSVVIQLIYMLYIL